MDEDTRTSLESYIVYNKRTDCEGTVVAKLLTPEDEKILRTFQHVDFQTIRSNLLAKYQDLVEVQVLRITPNGMVLYVDDRGRKFEHLTQMGFKEIDGQYVPQRVPIGPRNYKEPEN